MYGDIFCLSCWEWKAGVEGRAAAKCLPLSAGVSNLVLLASLYLIADHLLCGVNRELSTASNWSQVVPTPPGHRDEDTETRFTRQSKTSANDGLSHSEQGEQSQDSS